MTGPARGEVTIATTMWGEESVRRWARATSGSPSSRASRPTTLSHNYLHARRARSSSSTSSGAGAPTSCSSPTRASGTRFSPSCATLPRAGLPRFQPHGGAVVEERGHPRTGVGYQEQLDLSVTVSRHLEGLDGGTRREESIGRSATSTPTPSSMPGTRVAERETQRERHRRRHARGALRRGCCAQKQPLVFADVIRRGGICSSRTGAPARRVRARPRDLRRSATPTSGRGRTGTTSAIAAASGATCRRTNSAALLPMPAPMERPPGAVRRAGRRRGELPGRDARTAMRGDLVRSGRGVRGRGDDRGDAGVHGRERRLLPAQPVGGHRAVDLRRAMAAGLAVLAPTSAGSARTRASRAPACSCRPGRVRLGRTRSPGATRTPLAGLVINPRDARRSCDAARERITRHFELDHMPAACSRSSTRAGAQTSRPRDPPTPGLA